MKAIFSWIGSWIYLSIITALVRIVLVLIAWLITYITDAITGNETVFWVFVIICCFAVYQLLKKIIFGRWAQYAARETNPVEAGALFFIIFAVFCVVQDYPTLVNTTASFSSYTNFFDTIYVNNGLLFISSVLGLLYPIRVAQLGYLENKKIREDEIKEKVVEVVRTMNNEENEDENENPYDYEIMIAELLKRKGFTNIDTEPKFDEYGADLLAEYNGKKICIQCKMNSSKKLVGIKTIQEVYTAQRYYDCDYAFVYTTSDYTEEARKLAEQLNVKLYIYK